MMEKHFKKTKEGYKCVKCDKEYFDLDELIDCILNHEREFALKFIENNMVKKE